MCSFLSFSSISLVLGHSESSHFYIVSLLLCILIIKAIMISSSIWMMGFSLASSIYPLKVSHMFFSTVSQKEIVEKKALAHISGLFSNRYLYVYLSITVNSFKTSTNSSWVPLLEACQNNALNFVPLCFFLKLAYIYVLHNIYVQQMEETP